MVAIWDIWMEELILPSGVDNMGMEHRKADLQSFRDFENDVPSTGALEQPSQN